MCRQGSGIRELEDKLSRTEDRLNDAVRHLGEIESQAQSLENAADSLYRNIRTSF
jgi:chromosome segregation ATPase